jgi:hypothetical protein
VSAGEQGRNSLSAWPTVVAGAAFRSVLRAYVASLWGWAGGGGRAGTVSFATARSMSCR